MQVYLEYNQLIKLMRFITVLHNPILLKTMVVYVSTWWTPDPSLALKYFWQDQKDSCLKYILNVLSDDIVVYIENWIPDECIAGRSTICTVWHQYPPLCATKYQGN